MNNDRRFILGVMGALPALALAAPSLAAAQGGMDAITALKTRHSVRAYTDEPVSDDDIRTMLEAAMQAPSAANEQPWEFVVIRDKATLAKVGSLNPYATYAADAPAAILVCLNREREKIGGMGILDVAMSAENLMLAARALGLGSVFTGIYPMQERIQGFQKLSGLPDAVIPVGLVVIGHPDELKGRPVAARYRPESVHMEKW